MLSKTVHNLFENFAYLSILSSISKVISFKLNNFGNLISFDAIIILKTFSGKFNLLLQIIIIN